MRPGALGDALLAVPALRALRRRFAGRRLVFAGHEAAAQLLHGAGEVDQALSYEDPALGWIFGFGEPATLPKAVVAWQRDDSALRRRLAAAGVQQIVVVPSRPSGALVHVAAYLLETLAGLGAEPYLDARPLRIASVRTDEILLHPGSGSPAKNWPAEWFAEVIEVLQRHGGKVRVIVGEADGVAAAKLGDVVGDSVGWLLQPSLAEVAARLAGCRAYLGNDSGVSHLAGLVGAPTVALFGPTDPRLWAPLGPRVRVERFGRVPSEVAALVVDTATVEGAG